MTAWCIFTMNFYSDMKKNEIMGFSELDRRSAFQPSYSKMHLICCSRCWSGRTDTCPGHPRESQVSRHWENEAEQEMSDLCRRPV
ncbi:rCG43554 [Rattus norvegicus]|uniref:RCG43554 n=1 Tax=Rattus norvegicus TaxID=10116 RepID=A6JJ41_RAT|nr:rCG43554 [Rattus norvegicus]